MRRERDNERREDEGEGGVEGSREKIGEILWGRGERQPIILCMTFIYNGPAAA